MNADNIEIDAIVKKAEKLLEEEKDLPPALKSMFGILVVVIKLLVNRLDLNSRNSSKPPSSDPNLKRRVRRNPIENQVDRKVMQERLSGRLRSLTKYRLSILIGKPCRKGGINQPVSRKDRSLISISPSLSAEEPQLALPVE